MTPNELMLAGLRLVGNAARGSGAEGAEASRAPPEHRASRVTSTSARGRDTAPIEASPSLLLSAGERNL